MNVVLILLGLLLVIAALVDLVWTTVASSSGAGPLTGRAAPWLWRGVLAIHRRRPSHPLLSASAVVLVLVVIGTWLLLMGIGWWLITLSDPIAVVSASTGTAAGPIDRLYFTGYTVFTLGNGEFRPVGAAFQLVTVAMAGSGLVLVTLSITYLMPLATAAATQRSLAGYIFSLGGDPQTMLVKGWNGSDFGALESHLINLAPLLHDTGQSHLTYPILHYFHPTDPRASVPPTFAVLAQALELLESAVAPDARPASQITEPCREGVRFFLDTLEGAHVQPADQPIPLPPTDGLARARIPLASDDEYRQAGEASIDTRRTLAGLLRHTGWTAADVRNLR